MPSKTKAQARLMAAAAHNPAFAKKVGIPVSVAKEFNKADTGKKFKEGGIMATKKMRKFGDGGFAEAGMMGGMGRIPSGNASYSDAAAKMKRLGVKPNTSDYRLGMKTLTSGTTRKELEDLIPKMPKSYDEESGMKKGGKVTKESKKEMREEMKMDKAQDKAMIKKAVGMHDKQQHGGKKTNLTALRSGGKVSQLSKADGVAIKGKSKGKEVKMCGGGYMKKGK